MKSIKKFLFIMVALATTLAFVSCSNGNGDDSGSSSGNNNASSNNNNNSSGNNNASDNSNSNGNNNGNGNSVARPSVVATYVADEDSSTLIFYSDETWEMTYEVLGKETTFYVGTTDWGNPAKNGYITLTIKKMLDTSSGKLRDVSLSDQEPYDIQITNGKLDLFGESFTRQ